MYPASKAEVKESLRSLYIRHQETVAHFLEVPEDD
jgi:hypothetical protein